MSTANFDRVHAYILALMDRILIPPKGLFEYPTPATTDDSFYAAMFCWDTHHMTLRYAMAGKPEMMLFFLKTMLKFQRSDGFISSMLTATDGPYFARDFHAQPFLAQNAAEYCRFTGDTASVEPLFGQLESYLEYWLNSAKAPLGLFRWHETYMSGFDNEIAGTIFPIGTILPPDLPSLLCLECRSLAYLARVLKRTDAAARYEKRADEIKNAVNAALWDDEMEIYSAFNLATMKPQTSWGDGTTPAAVGKYAYVSCPSLMPLFSGIATPDRAKRMIERYVLAPEHFRSRFGIRSLSCSSEYYSNARWGNPSRFGDPRRLTNSNWQGPVWILLNWFTFHALLRYGFGKEAEKLADDTIFLLNQSLDRHGYFRENYHAETGEGLYADHFASWNLLGDTFRLYLEQSPDAVGLFPWEMPGGGNA